MGRVRRGVRAGTRDRAGAEPWGSGEGHQQIQIAAGSGSGSAKSTVER